MIGPLVVGATGATAVGVFSAGLGAFMFAGVEGAAGVVGVTEGVGCVFCCAVGAVGAVGTLGALGEGCTGFCVSSSIGGLGGSFVLLMGLSFMRTMMKAMKRENTAPVKRMLVVDVSREDMIFTRVKDSGNLAYRLDEVCVFSRDM